MTLTAQQLNRTQGAVSQQILRLETMLGAPLFERHRAGLSLTEMGERMLVPAHRMITENDALLDLARGVDPVRSLRVGVPPDVVGALMPAVLRAFKDEHPKVRVTLVSDSSQVLRDAVSQGTLDLSLSTDAGPSEGESCLIDDTLTWVGAPDGAAHTVRPIPVALGDETCSFRAGAVAALVRAGLEWRPAVQVGSLQPVIATIAADMAIAVFMSQTIPDGLVEITDGTLPPLPRAFLNLVTPERLTEQSTDFAACLRRQLTRTAR